MEQIKVNPADLSRFLRIISEYGKAKNNPFLIDASRTLWDSFFGTDIISADLVKFSGKEIWFEEDSYLTTHEGE